jgi:hypothetical protein
MNLNQKPAGVCRRLWQYLRTKVMNLFNISTNDTRYQVTVVATGKLISPNQQVKIHKKPYTFHAWHVAVRCPYCGKLHYHGWDPTELEEKRVRTRLSHCSPGGDYYIQIEGE